MSIRLALLGQNISHSKSPEIYRRLISSDVKYDLLDISEKTAIPSWEELARRYDGVNITTPWKEVFAGHAVAEVSHLKAVNCLRLSTLGCQATNTDWTALKLLLPQMLKLHGCADECVLLGSGVMARITTDVCSQLSIRVEQYARTKGDQLESLLLSNGHSDGKKRLLINACGRSFNFSGTLRGAWVFWDFNYAHIVHQQLQSSGNLTYVDGGELLEMQAKHAIQFWNRTLTH